MLGLRFRARAFSSRGERGPLLIAARGPVTIAASPVAEQRLQTLRLSSCGSRAQLLRGTWDPPRPGLEPASPASAGRLPTTAPPGKPQQQYSWWLKINTLRNDLPWYVILWKQIPLKSLRMRHNARESVQGPQLGWNSVYSMTTKCYREINFTWKIKLHFFRI